MRMINLRVRRRFAILDRVRYFSSFLNSFSNSVTVQRATYLRAAKKGLNKDA